MTPARAVRAGIGALLHAGDLLLRSKAGEPRLPPLFILGLPRSGTTLVYQYVVHRLAVAYFTNGVGLYSTAPCTVTLIQRRLHGDYRSDFASRFGKVDGAVAPREAGGFWGRYFGIHDYVGTEPVGARAARELRGTVACVERIFGGAPFVNKNVKHMLRIGALATVFRDSRFLIVERDPVDVALSVYRARLSQDDPTQWWSVRPPAYGELLGLPIEEQVARQLSTLRDRMSTDLSRLAPERVLHVSYDEFCSDPESLTMRLRRLWPSVGERNAPVRSFQRSRNRATTEGERRLVQHPAIQEMAQAQPTQTE